LTAPWRRLDVVTETGSTNVDLLARAAAGEDIDGAVLIAEHQTAGRGRGGRGWAGVARSQIILSVGIGASQVDSAAWGLVPLAAGLAVLDMLDAVGGIDAGLKWPNDVLVGDRKLAGILAEVASPNPLIVVGIGVNITLRAEEIDDAVATSLTQLGVENPDRDRLVRVLLDGLGARIASWRNAGGPDAALLADYRARSLTIGSRVRAILPGDREIVGVARDIDEQGRLRIDADGTAVEVSAGDVIHLRPVG
jgi:BirA family transcriptional regulator, biotin operon repressor / biotin---[acetyl-CoA-carboxylase] ligase